MLAIPEALSQLGIVDRFLAEPPTVGAGTQGLLATLAVIEVSPIPQRQISGALASFQALQRRPSRDLIVGQAMDGRHLLRGCLGSARALPNVLLGQGRRTAPHLGVLVQRRGADHLEALGAVPAVSVIGRALRETPSVI